MHVSVGPGSTHEIPSKANPQSKFPHDFLLNPGRNPVASQEPFGLSKQPTLNIPSGSQAHVGNDKWVDGGDKKDHWKILLRVKLFQNLICLFHGLDIAPKGKSVQSQESIEDCDELYTSSPLVHQENVTGHHHPYAFKARTAHASSSREKIMDDED
ncbi:hypothetical protein O181_007028 [Austropuccinia psidii MF-1]|uniref:Uncharacterized protein n=1 Tax=Austropuccinia psidii MF-1 TaxID=1389203 RepID=A0A9Q3BLC6_9BASI|nr:hypothetical protein [Austropuccinia psidii MF-1]